MKNYTLHANGAVFLAAAVVDLFPGTRLMKSGTAQHGFFCDFIFPFEFQSEFLSSIEEKMRMLAKEERPIKQMEMVPISAAGLLRHLGQPLRAEEALQSKGPLLKLVQMGDFADLCSEAITHELGYFKVLQIEGGGLIGYTFPSKEELKQFLKEKKLAKREDCLGEYLDQGVWLPKGEVFRQKLVMEWRTALKDFSPISTPYHTVEEHRKVGGATAEIFFADGYIDRAYHFCRFDQISQVCNSCLQIVVKFLTIFSFEFEMIPQENIIEFRLFDSWGRPWVGPFVKVETDGVTLSLFGQMERFVTLLLERGKI